MATKYLVGVLAGVAMSGWVALDIWQDYTWVDRAKRTLEGTGLTIIEEIRVGHIALPWTWFVAPVKQLNYQRPIGEASDRSLLIIRGYLRDEGGRPDLSSMIYRIDCEARRLAYIDMKRTNDSYPTLEDLERAFARVEWIDQAKLTVQWRREWFARILKENC